MSREKQGIEQAILLEIETIDFQLRKYESQPKCKYYNLRIKVLKIQRQALTEIYRRYRGIK